MVLAGKNQPSHSGGDYCPHPLLGVKPGRIEYRFVLAASAPLVAGKGIDGKVNESVKLSLLEA